MNKPIPKVYRITNWCSYNKALINDALGSTRGLTDENGQITDTYNYDAFGANTEHQGTSNNKYQYAGDEE